MPINLYNKCLTILSNKADGLDALELRNLKHIIDCQFTADVLDWSDEQIANKHYKIESLLIDQIQTLTPTTFGEICFAINC